MQAQLMKSDELQEAQPEGTSQRSVTDWLMHVISGKEPPEVRLRAENQELVQPEVLKTLTPAEMPMILSGSNDAYSADPEEEAWTGAFTAEDLCGAPAIPVPARVEMAEAGTDEITADDVCWVPENRRLKPQPVIAQAPAPVHMASVLDITREPAPRFENGAAAPVTADIYQITAADITKQWVIDEMEEASAAELAAREQAEREAAEAAAREQAEREAAEAAAREQAEREAAEAAAREQAELEAAEAAAREQAELEAAEAAAREQAEREAAEAAAREREEQEVAEEPAVIHAAEPAHAADEPAAVASAGEVDSHVWAREGYWGEARPHAAVEATKEQSLQPVIEGAIEKGSGSAQQSPARGVLGSYLAPEELEELEKAKPEGWSASWRTLIRLGSALPWLSRALPALESGLEHQGATAAVPQEVQQDMAGIRLVQYEIRTTVQDHSAQLKRMEEQLTRVRESVETNASERDLASSVESAMKLLKIVGVGLGGLLVLLIVLAVIMLAKH